MQTGRVLDPHAAHCLPRAQVVQARDEQLLRLQLVQSGHADEALAAINLSASVGQLVWLI